MGIFQGEMEQGGMLRKLPGVPGRLGAGHCQAGGRHGGGLKTSWNPPRKIPSPALGAAGFPVALEKG